MTTRPGKHRQRGFLIMAGIFLVVVVGAFIGYLATQSNVQQVTAIDDFSAARALQAARAGLEVGAYNILGDGSAKSFCVGGAATQTITFTGNLSDFTTTLSCTSTAVTESGKSVRTYLLTSNACNSPSAGACPNTSAAPASTYVDREVAASISCVVVSGACDPSK